MTSPLSQPSPSAVALATTTAVATLPSSADGHYRTSAVVFAATFLLFDSDCCLLCINHFLGHLRARQWQVQRLLTKAVAKFMSYDLQRIV
jgi:hypothetical protein